MGARIYVDERYRSFRGSTKQPQGLIGGGWCVFRREGVSFSERRFAYGGENDGKDGGWTFMDF